MKPEHAEQFRKELKFIDKELDPNDPLNRELMDGPKDEPLEPLRFTSMSPGHKLTFKVDMSKCKWR